MTTEEYLSQVGRLNFKITSKLEEICQLKEMAKSISLTYSDFKVQTTSQHDRLEKSVVKIVLLKDEVERLVDECIDTRQKIIKQIDSIEDANMYKVLTLKYVVKKDWKSIASEMNYSLRRVVQIHSDAVIEFERLYGNDYLKKDFT